MPFSSKHKETVAMSDEKSKDTDIEAYRETLLADRAALQEDILRLENENYNIERQIKELETDLLEKNKITKELSSRLHDLKKRLITFTTEESNLNTEISLLETEKGKIITEYNKMSQECGDNLANLTNTILKIDFIKGEIESLKAKIKVTEKSANEEFNGIDALQEKLSWSSKAFNSLYENMKSIEKDLKIKFYTKE